MKTTLLLIVSFIFLVMTACNSEKKESKIQTKDALENIMGRKSVRKGKSRGIIEGRNGCSEW